MIEAEWWEFDDMATLSEEVAGDVGFIIEKAIETNGKAELALPGDPAAAPVLEALAARDLAWDKVRVFPTDENIVPVGSDQNSYERLDRIFGSKGATVSPLIDHSQDWSTKEAGRSADARLAGFSWPVDLVWLGMGDDGSTAAILPKTMDDALNTPRDRRAVGVETGGTDRVTLTRNALLSAHTMIVTLAGEKAKSVLERAIDDGPLSGVPIGRVLAEAEVPVDIYWSAKA